MASDSAAAAVAAAVADGGGDAADDVDDSAGGAADADAVAVGDGAAAAAAANPTAAMSGPIGTLALSVVPGSCLHWLLRRPKPPLFHDCTSPKPAPTSGTDFAGSGAHLGADGADGVDDGAGADCDAMPNAAGADFHDAALAISGDDLTCRFPAAHGG